MNKRTRFKDAGKVLLLLADEAAIIVVIVLVMWIFKIRIQLWLAIVIVVLLGLVAFFVSRAAIPTFRRKHATGTGAMIGQEGTVVEEIAEEGVVRVMAEYWRARSVGGVIGEGEVVEVVAVEKLTLVVKKWETAETENGKQA